MYLTKWRGRLGVVMKVMKITREFWFYPSWSSRGYSWETDEDIFLIPNFNTMAKILNDRGWEIIEYKIVKDTQYYGRNEIEFNKARFTCCKNVRGKFKEEKYDYYAIGKNGELELL